MDQAEARNVRHTMIIPIIDKKKPIVESSLPSWTACVFVMMTQSFLCSGGGCTERHGCIEYLLHPTPTVRYVRGAAIKVDCESVPLEDINCDVLILSF